MNTEQTAQQLELAAQILRTGHPWEWQASDGEWVKPTTRTELRHVISDGLTIRPVLATPPDRRPLHNPDNLTAEQVGVGYRLALPEEMDGRFSNGKDDCDWWSMGHEWKRTDQVFPHNCPTDTIRLPLSTPWPEAKPDPYAALKKAHAEGKVIQGCINGHWIECPHPTWKYPVNTYREKPDAKKTVPLGPEDVRCGDEIQHDRDTARAILKVMPIGVDIFGLGFKSFEELQHGIFKIRRRNSDAWEPCHKRG